MFNKGLCAVVGQVSQSDRFLSQLIAQLIAQAGGNTVTPEERSIKAGNASANVAEKSASTLAREVSPESQRAWQAILSKLEELARETKDSKVSPRDFRRDGKADRSTPSTDHEPTVFHTSSSGRALEPHGSTPQHVSGGSSNRQTQTFFAKKEMSRTSYLEHASELRKKSHAEILRQLPMLYQGALLDKVGRLALEGHVAASNPYVRGEVSKQDAVLSIWLDAEANTLKKIIRDIGEFPV